MSVSGGVARLSVSDNGPGVAEAERERVFLKFSRGWDRKDRGGAGLGLAISREIMRRFGGDLTLAPARPGEGARFEARLPVIGATRTGAGAEARAGQDR